MRAGRMPRGIAPDGGATAVEYALIIAFIAVVIAGVVATLGSQVSAAISSVIPGL